MITLGKLGRNILYSTFGSAWYCHLVFSNKNLCVPARIIKIKSYQIQIKLRMFSTAYIRLKQIK